MKTEIKNIVIGGLIVLAVVFGVFTFKSPTAVPVPAPAEMGAVVGPELDFPSWTVDGVRHWYFSSPLNTASTTLCSFKVTATSTLVFASLKITTGTTTAVEYEIGKDNTSTAATTTSFGIYKQSTTAIQVTLLASTTPSLVNDDNVVFKPNSHLNFKYGAGSGACTANCNTLVGQCKAEFIEN